MSSNEVPPALSSAPMWLPKWVKLLLAADDGVRERVEAGMPGRTHGEVSPWRLSMVRVYLPKKRQAHTYLEAYRLGGFAFVQDAVAVRLDGAGLSPGAAESDDESAESESAAQLIKVICPGYAGSSRTSVRVDPEGPVHEEAPPLSHEFAIRASRFTDLPAQASDAYIRVTSVKQMYEEVHDWVEVPFRCAETRRHGALGFSYREHRWLASFSGGKKAVDLAQLCADLRAAACPPGQLAENCVLVGDLEETPDARNGSLEASLSDAVLSVADPRAVKLAGQRACDMAGVSSTLTIVPTKNAPLRSGPTVGHCVRPPAAAEFVAVEWPEPVAESSKAGGKTRPCFSPMPDEDSTWGHLDVSGSEPSKCSSTDLPELPVSWALGPVRVKKQQPYIRTSAGMMLRNLTKEQVQAVATVVGHCGTTFVEYLLLHRAGAHRWVNFAEYIRDTADTALRAEKLTHLFRFVEKSRVRRLPECRCPLTLKRELFRSSELDETRWADFYASELREYLGSSFTRMLCKKGEDEVSAALRRVFFCGRLALAEPGLWLRGSRTHGDGGSYHYGCLATCNGDFKSTDPCELCGEPGCVARCDHPGCGRKAHLFCAMMNMELRLGWNVADLGRAPAGLEGRYQVCCTDHATAEMRAVSALPAAGARENGLGVALAVKAPGAAHYAVTGNRVLEEDLLGERHRWRLECLYDPFAADAAHDIPIRCRVTDGADGEQLVDDLDLTSNVKNGGRYLLHAELSLPKSVRFAHTVRCHFWSPAEAGVFLGTADLDIAVVKEARPHAVPAHLAPRGNPLALNASLRPLIGAAEAAPKALRKRDEEDIATVFAKHSPASQQLLAAYRYAYRGVAACMKGNPCGDPVAEMHEGGKGNFVYLHGVGDKTPVLREIAASRAFDGYYVHHVSATEVVDMTSVWSRLLDIVFGARATGTETPHARLVELLKTTQSDQRVDRQPLDFYNPSKRKSCAVTPAGHAPPCKRPRAGKAARAGALLTRALPPRFPDLAPSPRKPEANAFSSSSSFPSRKPEELSAASSSPQVAGSAEFLSPRKAGPSPPGLSDSPLSSSAASSSDGLTPSESDCRHAAEAAFPSFRTRRQKKERGSALAKAACAGAPPLVGCTLSAALAVGRWLSGSKRRAATGEGDRGAKASPRAEGFFPNGGIPAAPRRLGAAAAEETPEPPAKRRKPSPGGGECLAPVRFPAGFVAYYQSKARDAWVHEPQPHFHRAVSTANPLPKPASAQRDVRVALFVDEVTEAPSSFFQELADLCEQFPTTFRICCTTTVPLTLEHKLKKHASLGRAKGIFMPTLLPDDSHLLRRGGRRRGGKSGAAKSAQLQQDADVQLRSFLLVQKSANTT
eukprot:gene11087-17037_t